MGVRMPLRNHDEARRALSRKIRAFDDDTLDEKKFRAECYGLKGLLEYFKFGADLKIEERIAAIEKELGITK